MNETNYIDNYGKPSFSDLIQSYKNWQDGRENLLDVNNAGNGNIRVINIEPGLQLRIWDCTFTNGLAVLQQAQHEQMPRRNFTL
ncbi:MAG TPA: hypothetical protein VGO58_13630, partial [Chitinophagaceae bacterium]|nr:hypothetical protein [Chitinophagaceae bacterium]